MSIEIRPNPAVTGGVTGALVYKGSYNATTNTPDLTSSNKGDFYIVSVAGTLAGVTLNVGDHIVFNQDASSPITSAMFDVIDNTDAVASVNSQTGVVVLGASDVSALAIANNLSDLNDAATARTNLSLGTSATLDVGTGANNVVQLDGSSRLPAVDGSQLTNITATDATKLAIANNLSDLNNAGTARTNLQLGTVATLDTGTSNGNVVVLDATGLPAVDGSQLTNVTGTDATKLAIANNLSDLNNVVTARSNLNLGTVATLDTGTSNGNVVVLDATGLPAVDGSQLTNVTATDATKLAIANNLSDLNNAGTARSNLNLGTSATLDVGTSANNVVQLDGSSRLPAVDGSQLTNISATDSTKLAIANNLSDLNNAATARTNLSLGTVATLDVGTGANNVVQLDGSSRLPAVDGSQLTNISATDSTKLAIANNLSDLNNAATARTNLSLGTVATLDVGTGANNVVQLDGSSRLPAVDGSQLTNVTGTDATKLAIANNLSDLNNAATARTNLSLGTVATLDVGTSANNVVQLDGSSRLPAVDGSQLTNISATDATKLAIANNLSDLNNAATARTNLSLGTVATLDVGTSANNVVQLDGSSRLPAVDGSQLTNVTATETDTLNDVVGRGATTSTPITVGDLKINSNSAGTSTSGSIATLASNNNIKLDPHGSGVPELVGNATRGSGQILFNCEQNSHGIILKGPPHSAGATYTMILPDGLGTAGQYLKLENASTGELGFDTPSGGGGGGWTYQARDTTNHSPLTPSANYHYSINANSATFVVNLPALSSVTDGDQIRVKFQARGNAAYDITINRNGTDTIDGQTSFTLDVLYSSVTIVAGSTQWEIV